MAHFAKIDRDGIVVDVIKSEFDYIASGAVGDIFEWVQTSYNNSFRDSYAGIGDTYDKVKDTFIKPSPYPSWILNETSGIYEAPFPQPDIDNVYAWDEITQDYIQSV